MANLLVTLMDKMDVPVEKIGGSTGKLPHRHPVGRVNLAIALPGYRVHWCRPY